MSILCRNCGSSDFRTSRFRKSDLSRLFLFQLPVRCRSCQERAFVFVQSFLKVRQEERERRRLKSVNH